MINTRRITLATLVAVALAISIAAQTQSDPQKARPRTTTSTSDAEKDKVQAPLATGDAVGANSSPANGEDNQEEAAAINPYYKNFFSTYKLGPEDIISVDVFNQPRYSRAAIIVPPSGRVSLPLIKGGVFVNSKTVDEVAEIIKKRYEEYILEPQVTVSLDKAMSYRYSVIGDVGQPGIRLMNHRMTVSEAIAEAGGVLNTGSKSKIVVLRRQQTGVLAQIPVNLSKIYKGQAPDSVYLEPGDQIIVPGNTLKKIQSIMALTPIASFARIFGAPVP